MKFNFGKNRFHHVKVEINGNTYKTMEANEFLKSFFYWKEFPSDEWWLKTILIAGAPQMGKSVIISCMIQILKNRYGTNFSAYETDDLVYFISAHKPDTFIIMLIIDDAIRPDIDSRRSMSAGNVSLTQSYYLIRHILEKNSENHGLPKAGIMIVVMAGQDYDRFDKGIKVCADLTIFKSYNPYLEKMTPKLPEDEIIFLKDFTEDAKTFNSNEARSYALGRTIADTYIEFQFPFLKLPIPKINKPADYLSPEQIKINQAINLVKQTVKDVNILKFNSRALQGLIQERLEGSQLDLPQPLISRITDIEFYHQYIDQNDIENDNSDPNRTEWALIYIDKLVNTLTFEQLENKYGIPKTTIHRNFKDLEQSLKIGVKS